PVRALDPVGPGLRVHARDRHDRVAVHGGPRDPGDHDDGRGLAADGAAGGGKPKRKITVDFMGNSKFFFTMSGVILVVGALAIGGRGLNLGIDFTSGTTAQVTLARDVPATEVAHVASAAGAPNPTVVKVGKTGREYKISFKKAGPVV